MDLESCTATSFPAFSMSARASFADGIRLNEPQFEEPISNRSKSDISGGINDDLARENESDSDQDAEDVGVAIYLDARFLTESSKQRLTFMITFNE